MVGRPALGAGRRWMSCDFTSCSPWTGSRWCCIAGCLKTAADHFQEASKAEGPVAQGRNVLCWDSCSWNLETLLYVPVNEELSCNDSIYLFFFNIYRTWQRRGPRLECGRMTFCRSMRDKSVAPSFDELVLAL